MGEARRISHSKTVAYAVILAAVALAGCGIRNPPTPCEWVPSPSLSLLEEIKRAEDIAIRHIDATNYGKGTPVRREAHERCLAQLFGTIASTRNMSIEAVRDARRQLDRRGFDWAVNMPMAGFTLAVAFLMIARVRRRFPDETRARVAGIVLLSVALGVLVIGVGQVWAFAVEGIRIGNDHLSYRGLRIPWGKHRATTFALAVMAMWLMAAMPRRRTI